MLSTEAGWHRMSPCGGLTQKCLPQSHVFEHLVPVDGIVWGGCGIFRKQSFTGGTTYWGWALRVCSLAPLLFSFFLLCVCR